MGVCLPVLSALSALSALSRIEVNPKFDLQGAKEDLGYTLAAATTAARGEGRARERRPRGYSG